MSTMKNIGMTVVASAAMMLSNASFAADSATMTLAAGTSATVHCYGINSCKGQSICKTAMNACKGQNSCKGKGVIEVSAETCNRKGGTVVQ